MKQSAEVTLQRWHAHAIGDWSAALRLWRLWTALGREDLSDRYRRSLFGVSWILTSFAAFVVVKIAVFGQMTSIPLDEFSLFVAIGFGVWSYINAVVCEACTAFTASTNWIKGSAVPYPVFILQVAYRNLLVFGLILLVVLGVLLWKKQAWSPAALTALPGLAMYVLASLWVAAILAPLCARYRDIQHAVQTVMRLMFFVTPILWVPGQTPQLARIAEYNPLTHFIEILRAPLVYDTVPVASWAVVAAVSILGTVAAVFIYSGSRNRLVYWL